MAEFASNPFATKFTRPGELAFAFPAGESAEEVIGRLEQNGWQGQIVGPHGSGKSTLLHHLEPLLVARGRKCLWFRLSQGERRLQIPAADLREWNELTQVIVDGYEQLGWLARRWLRGISRRSDAGLLITTHRDLGLPTLLTTEPSEELAWQLTQRLQSSAAELIAREDVSRCYQTHAGNLRETLFDLYDLYERRSRQRSQGS